MFSLCVLSATSAKDDYYYRKLTMRDGLPSNAVRSIVLDHYGYLWFGTDNGLCRYDGHHVQVYPIALCGINQYVSSLKECSDGLFVGTDNGVFHFSFLENRFERLPLDIHTTVTGMALDKDSLLWVTTNGQGVFCYLPKSGQVRQYNHAGTNGQVNYVMADRENRIWTISNTHSPLHCLNRLHNRFEAVNIQFDQSYNSLCMLQARDGTFYLGTWTQGLLRLYDNGHVEQLLSPQLSGKGFHIHTLCQTADDCICIGSDDGLLSYNPMTGHVSDMFAGKGINDRFVYSIASDNEGGLWVGLFYGGVDYLSPLGNRFGAFTTDDGLAGNVVSRFCEDSNGNIWMASDDGGLMCYAPSAGRFIDFPHCDVLSRMNVHALAVREGSELWVGTYTDGVYVLNSRTGRLRHYEYGGAHGLDDNSSYAILHDSKGVTWVATMRGINRYDSTIDGFQPILTLYALTIDIDEDREGTLWFSTQGGGLWRYNPRNGQSHNYQHVDGDPHSLPSDQVNCTLVDVSGRLWIGTMGGMCYYDPKTDRFIRVELLDERTVDVVGIVEHSGLLWISTEHGLLRYEPKETSQAVHLFTPDDGLISEQFLPNSCLKTSDGRLFFGSTIGFNTFYPYNIKINNIAPPVYITTLEVLNRQQTTDDGLPINLSFTRDITIDYTDARMLSFAFASLSYCSPQKNHYAYMLEGFDKDWNYVGTQQKATYTNLSAGTYLLRVKATNNDGVWSTDEARLHITVRPPLWWSWWAKLLYILVTAALFWYYVHLRLQRAEQRHQLELQRIREQNEAERRESRLNYFTMIAHEIRTPVSLIIAPLEKLKGDEKNTAQLDVIRRNAHRLLELVNQLLDFRKVEQQTIVMHFTPYNICDLMHSISERFEPTFEQGGKTLSTVYPPQRFSAIIDREGITKVISNLLTNANKYAKSYVELSCIIDPDEQSFHIIVADDGVGIRPEDQQRIFTPFYQAEDNKPGTGIGLSIVKSIVDLHHGTIDVASELGKGATFNVRLPLQQEISDTVGQQQSDITVEDDDKVFLDTNDTQRQDDELSPTTDKDDYGQPYMLIVDDNDDMVQFLADHFRQHYRILVALDGVEALALLSEHEVSIIVSDWMMPRMDGAELCRRVRQNTLTSHIPFLMLTAKTDNQSKVEGMNIGADIYIEKPFSVEYLEACIANILLMRRQLMKKVSTMPDESLAQMGQTPMDNKLLAKMNSIIEENVANTELSVNFLAEQLGISRSGLFAKIKSLTDITPNEMIMVVRLKRAALLLQEGQYLVSEVGYMVGFSSPSYFSKCFQKQFGVKPGDYLKNKFGHSHDFS